jgi:hypothetical protein
MTLRLLVGFVALCACQGEVPEHTSVSSAPIVGGEHTTGDPAVVMLFMQTQTGTATCTGTVVSPHVIATAAHCVHPDVLEMVVGPGAKFYVFTGDDAHDPEQFEEEFVDADSVVYHPEFDPDFDDELVAPPHDVGAVITKTPLVMPVMPIRRAPLDETWVGREARVVGFGRTDASDGESTGAKQVGTVEIAGVDETHVWTAEATPHICEGDSGGPMLGTENGVESLIGVHSWGEHFNTCTGDGYDVRVDTQMATFLDGLIAEHDPGFEPPSDGSGGGAAEGGAGAGAAGAGGGEPAEGGAASADDADDGDEGCSAAGRPGRGLSAITVLAALLAFARCRRA